MHSATELAGAKISASAPIFHKFSLEKPKVEFGVHPVPVVAENSVPPSCSSAECLSREGKERDQCWIVLPVGWAGMVGIAVVTPSESQKPLLHSTGNQAAGTEQSVPPFLF